MPKHLKKTLTSHLVTGVQRITDPNHNIPFAGKQPDVHDPNRINANDLFSLFTASIIKKKTTFTR